jgi:hypothetical protein
MRFRLLISAFYCALIVEGPAGAGVYAFSLDPLLAASVIEHPPGYVGSGGSIALGVCLTPAAADLAQPLDYAIKTWNDLHPRVFNATGTLYPPNVGPPGPDLHASMHSVLIHELGHCAFGLDHINRVDQVANPTPPPPVLIVPTTFTATKDFTSMTWGVDQVAGSGDDVVTVLPNGAENVSWFRLADNDPVIVDLVTPLNSLSYSRAYTLLFPIGDRWPASGNVDVATLLGSPRTQAIMVSQGLVGYDYLYLSADEVNMVKFAMNGLTVTAGTPADDYTVTLAYEPNCLNADVEIDFAPSGSAELGHCEAFRAVIPSATNHYRVTGFGGYPRPKIVVNSAAPYFWTFMIYGDGFENGNAAYWSAIVP